MLHVAPLLPFMEGEGVQQVERKRHIGNDILVIIFQDGDTPIDLDTFDSKQNHVFVALQPKGDGYQISIARKPGVPEFAPELPSPAFILKDTVSRDFLFHKREFLFFLFIVRVLVFFFSLGCFLSLSPPPSS